MYPANEDIVASSKEANNRGDTVIPLFPNCSETTSLVAKKYHLPNLLRRTDEVQWSEGRTFVRYSEFFGKLSSTEEEHCGTTGSELRDFADINISEKEVEAIREWYKNYGRDNLLFLMFELNREHKKREMGLLAFVLSVFVLSSLGLLLGWGFC